jgi:hypothetical protein
MRLWILASLAALTNCVAANESAFEFTAQREVLARPPAVAAESLIEAKFEPTKYELRAADGPAVEKWEQGFLIHARLPVDETFSLSQDLRTGVQTETILGTAFATTYRDALSLLEKTSAEFRASEALRLAASIQQQWLATNQIPFAEIVTYGTEAVAKPAPRTSLRLQAEWQERQEATGANAAQQAYRLAVDEEFVPKKLKAGLSAALVDSGDAAGRTIAERKWGAALFWSPDGERTALTLGAELADRDIADATDSALEMERVTNYHLKVRQRILTCSQIEFQAGRELHTADSSGDLPVADAWNLGANSEFSLREDWNAALGLRYRLRDDAPSLTPAHEFSLTLSVKARF